MHRRLYKTKSGRPTLQYFDAPAMMAYQMPSRAQETAHCRREDKPRECDEFGLTDAKLAIVPRSHLEIRKSVSGGYSGRGLFATQGISQNSHVAIDDDVKAFHVLPSAVSVMDNLSQLGKASNLSFVNNELSGLIHFVEGACNSSFAVILCFEQKFIQLSFDYWKTMKGMELVTKCW
jgi:hypothetical protein